MIKRTTKLILILFLVGSVRTRAAENPNGRWEGNIQIPGEELTVVVDLLQDDSGKWSGSITIPSLNVKGAPLADIAVKESDLNLTIKSALASQDTGPAKLTAHLAGDALTGNLLQGGNSAPFTLAQNWSAADRRGGAEHAGRVRVRGRMERRIRTVWLQAPCFIETFQSPGRRRDCGLCGCRKTRQQPAGRSRDAGKRFPHGRFARNRIEL